MMVDEKKVTQPVLKKQPTVVKIERKKESPVRTPINRSDHIATVTTGNKELLVKNKPLFNHQPFAVTIISEVFGGISPRFSATITNS